MSYAVWPASLPQFPQRGGWNGGPADARVAFKPDIGPAITRRRTTIPVRSFEALFPNLDSAQVGTFEDWVEQDLVEGTAWFLLVDPIRLVARRWMITPSEDQLYELNAKGARLTDLTIRLTEVPGTPWWLPYVEVATTGRITVPAFIYDDGAGVYGTP